MEHVKYELMKLNAVTQLDIQETPRVVTFQSIVQGRRVEKTGRVTVLLHWLPEQIFPDEWVCESQAAQMSHRTIPVTQVPHEALDTLHPSLLPLVLQKRKRKR